MIGAVGHIKVFRITLKSGAGKSSLARVHIGALAPSGAASITIHIDNGFSTKRVCDFIEVTLHEDRRARLFRARRSLEHTSELQSRFDLVCRLLLEKKKK